MPALVLDRQPEERRTRVLMLALLGFGSAVTGLWLWSCWCGFPSNPWNDIRVAPAVAWHHGFSVYHPAGSGPASTWAYGPLPLLLLWPAGLAPDAVGAIGIGGAIHILTRVIGLVVACMFWPIPPGWKFPGHDRAMRLAVALVAILLVRDPTAGHTVYSADVPAQMAGLLSLLALATGHRWLAAGAAAAAVACKQTMVGIGATQVIWLLVAESPKAAALQVGRGLAASALIAALAVVCFDSAGLWHVMFEMPGKYPWADVADRVLVHRGFVAVHVLLPLVFLLVSSRLVFRRSSPLLLPALGYLCVLPFSLAGFFKIGGNVNQLHAFWIWFPPTAVLLCARLPGFRWSALGHIGLAAAPALLGLTWLSSDPVRTRPNVQHYREALDLSARLPDQIWFPMHPLVTLYSDHRLYHDFDGLRARANLGYVVSDTHYLAHLPRDRKVMATLLPIGWGPADDPRLPPNSRTGQFGHWRLDGEIP